MTNPAFSALVSACQTTLIATILLASALAFSQVWDHAVYLRALQDTLESPL